MLPAVYITSFENSRQTGFEQVRWTSKRASERASKIFWRQVAAKALTESERHAGKAYDIGGAEALSYEDTAKILSREVGKRINYVNISENDFRQGMKEIGMDELFIKRAGHSSNISPVVGDHG